MITVLLTCKLKIVGLERDTDENASVRETEVNKTKKEARIYTDLTADSKNEQLTLNNCTLLSNCIPEKDYT